jgi:hypothetical protein
MSRQEPIDFGFSDTMMTAFGTRCPDTTVTHPAFERGVPHAEPFSGNSSGEKCHMTRLSPVEMR